MVDAEGHTALHFAAVNGHLQCAKALLEAGADPFVKAGDGVAEEVEGKVAAAASAAAAAAAAAEEGTAKVGATAQEMAHDAGQIAMDRMLWVLGVGWGGEGVGGRVRERERDDDYGDDYYYYDDDDDYQRQGLANTANSLPSFQPPTPGATRWESSPRKQESRGACENGSNA